MVRGINKFKEFFAGHEDNYIIIGGAACDILDELANRIPRATKDIDIILIVEALTVDFGKQFWEFVKAGNYETRQRGDGSHEYYRFMKPKTDGFPFQVELFARKPDVLEMPEEARYTPIPLDENLSSLSAILMNDDYYHFTLERSMVADGVRLADVESMIVLKAKAFVDLSERKAKGTKIDSDDINKHKKDIFRLATMLGNTSVILPSDLQKDIDTFVQMVSESLPDKSFFKSIAPTLSPKEIFIILCEAFQVRR
jgi:hypothetical protein